MSKCVVHMQKMKMSAMGGMQSHNQREHESRKNKDIDYTKSDKNFDILLDENINYQRAVKERIAELDLKKAVRKDAVVYCSFIVSSDRSFFESLGEQEHIRRAKTERESVSIGVEEPTPFEYTNDSYKEDCIREGSRRFFERATQFFCERYGAENVINATVHVDEFTPHMHLGIVPVTADGRLSAKEIFNPLELKQLQTAFAEEVGERFNLERGKEGSKAQHLDELTFKVKKQQEKLKTLGEEVWALEYKQRTLENSCENLDKQAESLSKTILDLKADISTLDTQKRLLAQMVEQLEEYRAKTRNAIEKIMNTIKANVKGSTFEAIKGEIKVQQAFDFIERNGHQEAFERFCEAPQRAMRDFSNPLDKKPHSKPKDRGER